MKPENEKLALDVYEVSKIVNKYPPFHELSEDEKVGLLCMNHPNEAAEEYKAQGRECRYMTMQCYPAKITAEEFFEELLQAKDSFISNMKSLKRPEKDWAENWLETLQAWIEMEEGDFD